MDESREHAKNAAVDAVSNIIYTAIFDYANDLIAAGVDQEVVLKTANEAVNKYSDDGIKVRKRPVPKPKAPKKEKDKPIDIITAATKKMGISKKTILWITHPEDDNYSYTTDLKLATGYPVKNKITNKLEMVATDDKSMPLTIDDVKIARSYNLDVDLSSISKN